MNFGKIVTKSTYSPLAIFLILDGIGDKAGWSSDNDDCNVALVVPSTGPACVEVRVMTACCELLDVSACGRVLVSV